MAGPRGSNLIATVASTATVQTISVVLQTFDTLTNPCNYLLTELASRIKAEVGAPTTSTLGCSLVSSSLLADARREYRWTVTASWMV